MADVNEQGHKDGIWSRLVSPLSDQHTVESKPESDQHTVESKPEGKARNTGAFNLFGPMDTTEQHSGQTDLLSRLVSPLGQEQQRSTAPAKPAEAKGHHRINLFGPLDSPTQPEAQRPARSHEVPGPVQVLFTLGVTARDAVVAHRRHRQAQAPVPAAPEGAGLPPQQALITGAEAAKLGVGRWDQIRLLPRSTWADHPDIMQVRARIAQLPRSRQVAAAEAELQRLQSYEQIRQAALRHVKISEETRLQLGRTPLTTADWHSYAVFQETLRRGIQEQDFSVGVMRFVTRNLWNASRRLFRRWFDDLATRGPVRVTRTQEGAMRVEVPESNFGDHAIFDGRFLILINPDKTDAQRIPIENINATVRFGVEGAAPLQPITAVRTTITGQPNPALAFGRGLFVVRNTASREELVRVPIADPIGFERALREMIAVCQTPPRPPSEIILPGSIRDLIEYPEDAASNRWRYEEHRRDARRRQQNQGDGDHEDDDRGGDGDPNAGDEGPRDYDIHADVADLKQEVHQLRSLLQRLTQALPPGQDDEVIDGEFREA